MTVLLNTVCPYEAFSGLPDDSYCQRQIFTVDSMHIQWHYDLKAAARGGNHLFLRLVVLLEGKVQYSVLTEKTVQYVSTTGRLQHVHEKNVWYYEYVKTRAISEIHKVSVSILYPQAKSCNYSWSICASKKCISITLCRYFQNAHVTKAR